MDHKFTEQIKDWLDTPEDERDYMQGALFMLKLSGNQIMYRNAIANIATHRRHIEYQIQKYYDFRVRDLTHRQVMDMQNEVSEIVQRNIPLAAQSDKSRRGKRDDHDTLPEEIRGKYVENLTLLRRMRELHMKLRSLSTDSSPCPDSERYPFLKEIIAIDKKLRANWESYDRYIPSVPEIPEKAPSTKKRSTVKKTAKSKSK